MVKEKRLAIISYIISAVLFTLGGFYHYFAIPEHLSFGFLSAGLSALIHSVWQTKRILSFKKNPKKYEIEQIESKDERNHLILQISKAKTFETSSYLLIVFMLVFVVLDEPLFVLILFSFGFISLSVFLWNLSKQQKRI